MATILQYAVPLVLKLLEIYFAKSKAASPEFVAAKEKVADLLRVANSTEERWKASEALHELQKK